MDALLGDLRAVRRVDAGTGARHVLDALFGLAPLGADAPLPLARFQAEAAARLMRILDVRGGALLADSVGLGKTHIALAVVAESIRRGCGEALVATPASLRRQWTGPLRRLAADGGARLAGPLATPAGEGPLVRWTSHARLSRGERPPGRPELVVVDEAHAFRNPRTRRYRELARLCTGARVLLVTATPVNNSLSDLYFLLRLFLADGGLADLGVADLRSFAGPGRAPRAGHAAIAAITVRRTRRLIESEPGGGELRFPAREPCPPVPYDLASSWGPGGFDRLIRRIAALSLDVHDVGAGAGAAHLVRAGLLKRLESSLSAFERSVARLEAFLLACAEGIPFGRLPAGRDIRAHDAGQLMLGPLLRGVLPAGSDAGRLAATVAADLRHLSAIRGLLGARSGPDPKLEALRQLLGGSLAGRSVLVFTEFADTARAIHRTLCRTWPTGLVTGRASLLGLARAPRRRVIESFAPVASGVAVPEPQRTRILVATDVLSEGLNLQDAGDVVSFDLPWNPIRLVQRAGRIDRAGSLHASIRVHNFLPDRGLDRILGLMARIRAKIGAIQAAGGFDAPRLPAPPDIDLAVIVGRIRAGDPKLLMDLEIQAESGFDAEEMARRATTDRTAAPRPPPADRRAGQGLPDCDEPPVLARLARPAGEAPGWLVVTSDGGVERFALVRRGRCVEDRETGLRLLALAASGSSSPPGADPEGLAEEALNAVDIVVRQRITNIIPAPPGANTASRVARLLLRRLSAEAGGATASDCARADAILDRLRAGLRAGVEAELRSIPGSCAAGPGSLAGLLARLEAALSGTTGSGSDAVAGAGSIPEARGPPVRGRQRLLGLFRLEPAAGLVLEPGPG